MAFRHHGGQVGQGVAAPQGESVVLQAICLGPVTARQCPQSVPDKCVEDEHVHLGRGDAEDVAGLPGGKQIGSTWAEGVADLGDQGTYSCGRCAGQLPVPQPLGQLVDGDDTIGVDEEERAQGTLTSGETGGCPVAVQSNLEGAEQVEAEGGGAHNERINQRRSSGHAASSPTPQLDTPHAFTVSLPPQACPQPLHADQNDGGGERIEPGPPAWTIHQVSQRAVQ